MPDLPPEPEKPQGGGDKEYLKWKKAHAQWSRLARDAGSNVERNEEEAMDRARQKGDNDFAQGIEDLMGYDMDDVRDALLNTSDDNLSIAEREAKRALERADTAWFFKASAQRHAHKKIKAAKPEIKKRIRSKKCSVIALVGLAITAFELYVIATGAIEMVHAVTP
jgi:hypothetical protein